MEKTKKNDDAIMKTLDVNVIRRLICTTNKGPLELMIRKGENNYFLTLDATLLGKEVNDKLMGILFKPEIKATNIPITISSETLPKVINSFVKKIKKDKELDYGLIPDIAKDIMNNENIPKKKGRPTKK